MTVVEKLEDWAGSLDRETEGDRAELLYEAAQLLTDYRRSFWKWRRAARAADARAARIEATMRRIRSIAESGAGLRTFGDCRNGLAFISGMAAAALGLSGGRQ